MNKWNKIIPAVLAVLMALALLAGCSGSDRAATQESGMASAPMAPMEEPMPAPGAAADYEIYYADTVAEEEAVEYSVASGSTAMKGVDDAAAMQQKLIKDVWLEGETYEFDKALDAITTAVNACGGYIQGSNVNGRKPEAYGDSGRSAGIVARIPAAQLDSFLTSAKGVIDVYNEDAEIQNVTSKYYDTQSRKETYEIQLERLEAILTEAAELSDIIALETEIARVRYEIEALETTLKNLDNRVNYSTVTIQFYELTQFSRPVATEQSLGERIGNAFSQSLIDIGDWFEHAIVWIFARWLLLLFLAVVIIVAVILIRRAIKRSSALKQILPRPESTETLEQTETKEETKE